MRCLVQKNYEYFLCMKTVFNRSSSSQNLTLFHMLSFKQQLTVRGRLHEPRQISTHYSFVAFQFSFYRNT